ncbi:cupin domain-containing protein [Planotetraspora phitsanulokensis]|uniref:Cupin n=1 Tax=Planotetraspora phitsanulokensis TaxID=575192 RepID=A0A8J3U2B2_9ACTN|nr:cupin domain-containing protein [Planotetraspora phitsanulokensis]GII35667.1 cupin [Planotetraspora phitsanulokensis]
MDVPYAPAVKVVQPGGGETAAIPGFGVVFKLYSPGNGAEVAIVEHPFAVGTITPPHLHTREDEHSIVLEGQIGFRSEADEVVLGPGGYITKPRGQMHAMWNAGTTPGRIIEVITPGGFENYFRELSELLNSVEATPGVNVRETPEFAELARRYGLTHGRPDWYDDVVVRYGLTSPTGGSRQAD